jgi:hypothetical protein
MKIIASKIILYNLCMFLLHRLLVPSVDFNLNSVKLNLMVRANVDKLIFLKKTFAERPNKKLTSFKTALIDSICHICASGFLGRERR